MRHNDLLLWNNAMNQDNMSHKGKRFRRFGMISNEKAASMISGFLLGSVNFA